MILGRRCRGAMPNEENARVHQNLDDSNPILQAPPTDRLQFRPIMVLCATPPFRADSCDRRAGGRSKPRPERHQVHQPGLIPRSPHWRLHCADSGRPGDDCEPGPDICGTRSRIPRQERVDQGSRGLRSGAEARPPLRPCLRRPRAGAGRGQALRSGARRHQPGPRDHELRELYGRAA